MRRRDFIISSAATAGAALPGLGLARPCTPTPVSAQGGTTANTACTNPSQLSDWQTRISGPGVVWYHNFESTAEVDNFRFQVGIGTVKAVGSSDGNTTWVSNDGFAGGGCVQLNIPTGTTCNSMWWRPFSPLLAGANSNGRSSNDPGANGTITPQAYDGTNPNQYNWTQGIYCNPAYAGAGTDGTDFYIQVRVKMSGNRANANNPPGKLMYIDVPNGGDQELIIQSLPTPTYNMYTNFGSRNNSYLGNPQGSSEGSVIQPGNQNGTNYWNWVYDQWVTLLIHVIPGIRGNAPGSDNVTYGGTPAANNTGVEVWAAKPGETAYTRIWSKLDYVWAFDTLAPGWNVLKCSGYMNNVNAAAGWTQRFTQIIFSKQTIPCPQV